MAAQSKTTLKTNAMNNKILLSTLLSVLFLSAPCALSQGAGQDRDPLAKFRTALTLDGFTMQTGQASSTAWAEQYCNGERDNAGYVNKAPYLMIQVPTSADDPTPVENFKFLPDEALVLIGPTPPPVKYFGYNAFLASRVPPNHPKEDRKPIIATLGDALNNATIKTLGPTPFNTPAVIIFTPDRGTDARIRTALRRSGFPPAIINTIVCPSSLLNLGESDTADELTFKVRFGMTEGDPAFLQAYVDTAVTTLTVLRVTPRTTGTADPFPVPPLRLRGTGHGEMDLMKKVEQLREGIIAAHQQEFDAVDIRSKPIGYEGYDYIQQGISPGADSRDNLFLGAGWLPEFGCTDEIRLADGEFLVVYGVNHFATGKASYASFNVYASEVAKISIGQVFHDKFPNTAAPYLPPDDPAASVLYAYKVSRNCSGELNCLPLSIENCPRLTIDEKTILGFFFRMYLEPTTGVGPAMQEIVYDRILKFSPRRS